MSFINCGLAILCAEDDLVEDLTITAHRDERYNSFVFSLAEFHWNKNVFFGRTGGGFWAFNLADGGGDYSTPSGLLCTMPW
jgi:hypothetical protein